MRVTGTQQPCLWVSYPFHILNRTCTETQVSQMALAVKNLFASAGDLRDRGSVLGSGRAPGGGHGNSLQHSCLETIPWTEEPGATSHRMSKSQTRLTEQLSMQAH